VQQSKGKNKNSAYAIVTPVLNR